MNFVSFHFVIDNSRQRKSVMISPRQPETGRVWKSPSNCRSKIVKQPSQLFHRLHRLLSKLWKNHHGTARRSRTVRIWNISKQSPHVNVGTWFMFDSNLTFLFCCCCCYQLNSQAQWQHYFGWYHQHCPHIESTFDGPRTQRHSQRNLGYRTKHRLHRRWPTTTRHHRWHQ